MTTGKHSSAGSPSLLSRLLGRLSPAQRQYLGRLGEQVAVTFAAAFAAFFEASGGSLSRAALGAALGAGARAVYGLWAKSRGLDSAQPQVK